MILAFKYLKEFFSAFLLQKFAHKECIFPFNSSNDASIDGFSSMCELMTMAGSNFLDGCKKILWGKLVMKRKPYVNSSL